MSGGKKNYTIRNASETSIQNFKVLSEKNQKPVGEFFDIIVNSFDPENTGNNSELENQIDALKNQCQNLKDNYEASKLHIDELQAIIQNSKLTGTQFICEPGTDNARIIQRCIAYLKRKGKLNDIPQSEYLNYFAKMAMNYYCKNEFNNILK